MTQEEKARKARNYDAEMATMKFTVQKIRLFDEDLKKMETMSREEKMEFMMKIRQEKRYIVVEE